MRRTMVAAGCLLVAVLTSSASLAEEPSPYPPSTVFESIAWHWETHQTAAPGSDLWPVTWGPDDELYTAWGDGGGFGGTNSDGRVPMGFARITGPPEEPVGANLNGGKNAPHPASFPDRGKSGSLLYVGQTLYASLNMQNGPWPDVDQALAWSEDQGATWQTATWVWPKGEGQLKLGQFLQFGAGYTGLPDDVAGYVYLYGSRQSTAVVRLADRYLARVPVDKIRERDAYEFYSGLEADGRPAWTANSEQAAPVFTGGVAGATYLPAFRRYLLASYHDSAGGFGLFDGPTPWGPWTTVTFEQSWGDMGGESHGLSFSMPGKWQSADGQTLWCVFSVYGDGAKQGINGHDRFNLVKATLRLRKPIE